MTASLPGEVAIAVSLTELGDFVPRHSQADIVGGRAAYHAPCPSIRSRAAGFPSCPVDVYVEMRSHTLPACFRSRR